MKSDGCLLNISTIQCLHGFITKWQTASEAVPVWAGLRARVPRPQHSAAHRHARRERPDVATLTSHPHRHTGTHSGFHRLRHLTSVSSTSRDRIRPPGRTRVRAVSSSQSCPHRSLGAQASGGLPGESAACPPKPCSTEEPQTDTEEPGQQDHHDRSVHTHSGQA